MLGTLGIVVGTAAAAATAAALPAVRPVLRRRNVLDVPNHRSAHTTPTLRGAGIGLAVGVAVGVCAALLVTSSDRDRTGMALVSLVVLAAATLGAREDVAGMGIRQRLVLQAVIASAGALTVVWWTGAALWWCVPLVVCTVGYVNVANFMDGVNAISGLHGAVAGVFFVVVGTHVGSAVLVFLGAVTAATFATWLPWNLAGRRMFLGDAGSYLLGALVSVSAAVALLQGVPLWVAAAPTAVYVVDAGWTLARRALRGERWYEAHRSHVYQQLVAQGRPHVGVAAFVATLGAVCGAAALVAWREPATAPWSAAVVVLVLVVYLATPRLTARRLTTRRLTTPRPVTTPSRADAPAPVHGGTPPV